MSHKKRVGITTDEGTYVVPSMKLTARGSRKMTDRGEMLDRGRKTGDISGPFKTVGEATQESKRLSKESGFYKHMTIESWKKAPPIIGGQS